MKMGFKGYSLHGHVIVMKSSVVSVVQLIQVFSIQKTQRKTVKKNLLHFVKNTLVLMLIVWASDVISKYICFVLLYV